MKALLSPAVRVPQELPGMSGSCSPRQPLCRALSSSVTSGASRRFSGSWCSARAMRAEVKQQKRWQGNQSRERLCRQGNEIAGMESGKARWHLFSLNFPKVLSAFFQLADPSSTYAQEGVRPANVWHRIFALMIFLVLWKKSKIHCKSSEGHFSGTQNWVLLGNNQNPEGKHGCAPTRGKVLHA